MRDGLARDLSLAVLDGKAVISFDIDGAREVCLTDKTGILTAPKDVQALSHAIVRLAEASELRYQLGATGRAKCREMYSHQRMTDRIRAIYEEVLQKQLNSSV